ncbi:hypothetical protein EV363DRAFT_1205935 [Boletus edulis]|nr:hypothetical protein EV363DRAFT_1205935 [Boletus edulis]
MTMTSVVAPISIPGSGCGLGRILGWIRPCLRWYSWAETRVRRWRVARITRVISNWAQCMGQG